MRRPERRIVLSEDAQLLRRSCARIGKAAISCAYPGGLEEEPSLHAADAGISVSTAVDVAKDGAEVILLQLSLRVLHSGIIEVRKAFGNVVK